MWRAWPVAAANTFGYRLGYQMMHRTTRFMFRLVFPLLLLLAVMRCGPDLSAQMNGYQLGSASDQTQKVKLEGTVINDASGGAAADHCGLGVLFTFS